MPNISKILTTIAGVGLMSLMTGCSQNEAIVTPPATFQTGESVTVTPPSDSSGNNIIDQIKPVTDLNKVKDKTSPSPSISPEGEILGKPNFHPAPTNELVALTDTEESAKEIAALYDIELKSFASGVAVYTTDKDPYEVIQLGIDNGYPTLSINHRLELH